MAPLIVFLISCSSTEIPEGNSQANSLTRDVFLPSTDYSLYTLIGPYEDLWLVSDEFKQDTVNSSFENLIKVETAKIIVSKDMSQTYGSIESNNIKNLQEIESYFEDEISGTILSKHQSNHVDAIFSNQIFDSSITGFGDSKAEILFIGLAPAAHGGNRTGRVFTGDKSADFLFKCLYKSKLSNQPNSEYRNDGLILYNTYLTAALKCVPPGDKPTPEELKTCFHYFKKEIDFLKNIKIIVALGKIAFDACLKFYK